MGQHSLYCTFRADGRLFGVPILDVKEVTTETTCTPIPHAPPEVVGYVNIRGHILLALSLRQLLGLPAEEQVFDRRLVIFKPAVGPAFGVIVDEIGDIVSVNADDVELRRDERELSGEKGDVVVNVFKLPSELLIVLEPRRFLGSIEQAFARMVSLPENSSL